MLEWDHVFLIVLFIENENSNVMEIMVRYAKFVGNQIDQNSSREVAVNQFWDLFLSKETLGRYRKYLERKVIENVGGF